MDEFSWHNCEGTLMPYQVYVPTILILKNVNRHIGTTG